MNDSAAFARLIQALHPWLDHLVIVGGWAHRLHRLHPLAGTPAYAPLRTRDVDVALSLRALVDGDIAGRWKMPVSSLSTPETTARQSPLEEQDDRADEGTSTANPTSAVLQ